MGNSNLEILISMLNIAINSLHDKKINVIDKENPDFRLSNVYYDAEADEVIFDCKTISEKRGVV